MIFFFYVSVSLIISSVSEPINCPAVKCGDGNPDIRYPFYCHGLQNQTCGHPGFRLSCNHRRNRTVTQIQLPEYDSGELEVKSISYDDKELILLDPKSCVHRAFLDLDQFMNLTPFKYYYQTDNFTYLNCSEKVFDSSPEEVPCLSSSGRHVYVVTASSIVPSSCRAMKTVAIPFSYSHYISDDSFGLRFTWYNPDQVVLVGQHEIVVGKGKDLGGVVILIAGAIVVILSCLKYYMRNDLAIEKCMMPIKMVSQVRDTMINDKMKEPEVKTAKLHHNSHTKI